MVARKKPDEKKKTTWQGRLDKDKSERLVAKCQRLKTMGKLKDIKKYHIVRFALESLLATLDKTFPDVPA